MGTITGINALGTHELHSDHLGTPRVITTASGGTAIIEGRQNYGPYGETFPAMDSGYAPLTGYTGHVQTDPTGLIYMRGRFYTPIWHRFVNSDQGADPSTWNQMAYVGGSPMMATDPTGLMLQVGDTYCDGGILYLVRSIADDGTVIGVGIGYCAGGGGDDGTSNVIDGGGRSSGGGDGGGGNPPQTPKPPCNHKSFWGDLTENFETTNNAVGLTSLGKKVITGISYAKSALAADLTGGLQTLAGSTVEAHLGPLGGVVYDGALSSGEVATASATPGEIIANAFGAFTETGLSLETAAASSEVLGVGLLGVTAFEVGNAAGSLFVASFDSIDSCP